jgi:AraC-like DNA-binding protein
VRTRCCHGAAFRIDLRPHGQVRPRLLVAHGSKESERIAARRHGLLLWPFFTFGSIAEAVQKKVTPAGRAGGRRRIQTVEPAFQFFVGAEAGQKTRLFRMFLVQRGSLAVQSAGARVAHSAGTLLLVPPGCAWRLVKGLDAMLRVCAFGRALVDPLAFNESVNLMIEILSVSDPLGARLPLAEHEQARALFFSLEREAARKGPGYQSMIRLQLMETLLLLSRCRRGWDCEGRREPIRFHPADAMREIRERCADQLSLSEIASRYGFNPSYFSRLFHRHAGMSLVEFINRARIQKSCHLLKRSDASIIEIALAAGYNNLSHFNRYFRRIMGMSPRQYRIDSKR